MTSTLRKLSANVWSPGDNKWQRCDMSEVTRKMKPGSRVIHTGAKGVQGAGLLCRFEEASRSQSQRGSRALTCGRHVARIISQTPPRSGGEPGCRRARLHGDTPNNLCTETSEPKKEVDPMRSETEGGRRGDGDKGNKSAEREGQFCTFVPKFSSSNVTSGPSRSAQPGSRFPTRRSNYPTHACDDDTVSQGKGEAAERKSGKHQILQPGNEDVKKTEMRTDDRKVLKKPGVVASPGQGVLLRKLGLLLLWQPPPPLPPSQVALLPPAEAV
ncbi:hypothetical protein GN956_G19327 [Arapaima gigas]